MSRAKGKNLITFGAPGTGKSYSIKSIVKSVFDDNGVSVSDEDMEALPESIALRTTFHPDSDYSTFVGCYKPQDLDGKGLITYKFSAQAFLNSYLNAWSTELPYFLIIEEINRGNCAQIFGDIFQLLDRKPNGEHEYDITPDKDIETYIKKWFEKHPSELDIPETIKNGTKLYLPQNITLLATMNTSDQSLFPMDSAFKRRWEWKFQNIEPGLKERKIKINDDTWYSWWSFLDAVNKRIYNVTKSEDKQLGYWFIKVDDSIGEQIDKDLFISKVVFYLWSDVFKDYGTSNESPFSVKAMPKEGEDETNTNDTRKDHLTFQSFFGKDGLFNLVRFLEGLKLPANIMPEEDKMDSESRRAIDNNNIDNFIAKPITSRRQQREIQQSEFVQSYKISHPDFVFDRNDVDFTSKKVKVTFPNKDVSPYVGQFTRALDFILQTIGKDSVELFRNVAGGAGEYAVIVPGDPKVVKDKIGYGSTQVLSGELEGYGRISNKSGNDMVDVFYEMLHLVKKEEDLFIIDAVGEIHSE